MKNQSYNFTCPASRFQRVRKRMMDGKYIIRFNIENYTEGEGEEAVQMVRGKESVLDSVPKYENIVPFLIGIRYSSDDEAAVSRKRESDPTGFRDYDLYCKQCKYEAKRILNDGELTLEDTKGAKIAELEYFDSLESEDGANWFRLAGQGMWLNKETRQSLAYSLERTRKAGESAMQVWCGTQPFTLSLDTVDGLLTALETYAKACYDRTASHKAAINALTTIKDVEAYDYRSGYPEHPSFSLE